MKAFLSIVAIAAIAGFTWNLGSSVDDTFVALIVGIVIGVAAAVPGGLLIIVATRRNESGGRRNGWDDTPPPRPRARYADEYDQRPMLVMQQPAQPQQQPPAPTNPWVVTGGGSFDDLPAPQQDGRFRLG